jgi:hypothetical protein
MFQNTYYDFKDCINALEECIDEARPISENEMEYAKRMYEACQVFIDRFEEIEEM